MSNVRIRVSIAGALVVLALSFGFARTPRAVATQGKPILAGIADQTETSATTMYDPSSEFTGCVDDGESVLLACGRIGLTGLGEGLPGIGVQGIGHTRGVQGVLVGVSSGAGVRGKSMGSGTGQYGVEGIAQAGEAGVYGHNLGDTGIGVWGQTGGTGSGVYGEAKPKGIGVVGQGGPTGVSGDGFKYGVEGTSDAAGGTGVYGHSAGDTGIGVWGENDGVGSAVYGHALGNGVGMFGESANGTAVEAKSPSGTALRVDGKASFSRSGTVTISYPKQLATISGVPVTAKSLAFATLQQFLSCCYVAAVVPNLGGSSNSFTIYLNRAPGSSSNPRSVVVAWQVIEKV